MMTFVINHINTVPVYDKVLKKHTELTYLGKLDFITYGINDPCIDRGNIRGSEFLMDILNNNTKEHRYILTGYVTVKYTNVN